MKTWIQSVLLLGNDKQKVVTDGHPYLREDCIHNRSVEGFDLQMLQRKKNNASGGLK